MNMLKMRDQKGFTLIEIIAVLVILWILAAVAIPKYFDLQQDAKNKAALSAISEGKARVNQYATRYVLTNSNWPATNAYTGSALGTDAGDFTIGYTSGSTITITASGKTGGPAAGGSAAGTMPAPGSL
jgi:prepilin-type N-terminal cleavage/methylation domain-containing protein